MATCASQLSFDLRFSDEDLEQLRGGDQCCTSLLAKTLPRSLLTNESPDRDETILVVPAAETPAPNKKPGDPASTRCFYDADCRKSR